MSHLKRWASLWPVVGAILVVVCDGAWAAGWTTGSAQGITEYRVENGEGNEFNISCDIEASLKGGDGTAILVTIAGKDPEPKTKVTVVLDDETFALPVAPTGMVQTDCLSCSDLFKAVWLKLRTAKTMQVRLADGASAVFSLEGASTVLPLQPCKTGFTG